jgi:hypothetical protein
MSSSPSERFLSSLLPKGFNIIRAGRGKHLKIICPDGSMLRDKQTGMPITVSSTPSGGWEKRVKRDIDTALRKG